MLMRFHWPCLGSECEILSNQVSNSAPRTIIFKACTCFTSFPTSDLNTNTQKPLKSPTLAYHSSSPKNNKQYRCFVRDPYDCISSLEFNVRPIKVKTPSMGEKT